MNSGETRRKIKPRFVDECQCTENHFHGNPPSPFKCWSDWMQFSFENGIIKGVRIESLPNKETDDEH